MVRKVAWILLAVSPWVVLTGCGGGSTAATASREASAPVAALDPDLVLTEEPAEVRSVSEVREQGQHGDEVVVAGWIGGSLEPVINGRAAFTMVDLRLPAPECTTKPYSYCCMAKEALLPNLIMVKFVDEDGRTILKDARGLLGIQEGSVVVVRGRIECSEDGVVNCIVADALFNRGYSDNPMKVAAFDTGWTPSK